MKYYRICAKINLDAIGGNLRQIRKRLPEGVKVMAVVKADAYGHGAVTVAEYLKDTADYFGVACVSEAMELRNNGINNPILILGYTSPSEYKTIVENNVEITVYRYSDAKKLSEYAATVGKTAKIHIKADTGMSRIGFAANENSVNEVYKISQLPNIEIAGIFSHYATSDDKDKTVANRQRDLFEKFVSDCEKCGVSFAIKHISNSAGAAELDSFYNMVRCGITVYGLTPSGEDYENYPLKPAMELLSRVTHIKILEKGVAISYGGTYVTPKEMKVATVSVGYADGYPRAMSNKGDVIIRGVRCPILGRVCMDQMMVDVSHLKEIEVEDLVTVVGKDGDEFVSAEEVAKYSDTVNYEIICGVSRRVPRVYIKDGEEYKTVTYLDR